MLEQYAKLLCSAPWSGCTVHWTGLVFPCCSVCEDHGYPGAHAHRMTLGDLNKQSLAEILGGEAAWNMRRAWIEGNISGYCCGHCHAGRLRSCSPYFRTDVYTQYVEKSFVRKNGGLERIRSEPFPLKQLEVQINASCQLRCNFCNLDYAPTGAPHLKHLGHMDVALFERLLDEAIALGGPGADLFTHWSGEPLLHPEKEKIYEIVGTRPYFNATIVTNGVNLTPDFVDRLLRQPRVPLVYVSLHAATAEGFVKTTGRDLFPVIRRNIEMLLERRKAAGRQNEMVVFVGFTVVEENVGELEKFIDEWRGIFAAIDRPPVIHLNGHGPSAPNTLIIVANGADPFSDAMRRAFWIVERARRDQEPSIEEIGRMADTDAWRDWRDPLKEFLDQEDRVESCMTYAPDEAARRRYRDILTALILRQGHCETAATGRVSDQTAGRLLDLVKEEPPDVKAVLAGRVRGAADGALRFSEEAGRGLDGALGPRSEPRA